MYFYLIAPATVVRAKEQAFTYHSEVPLAIGTLVRISIGKKQVNGVVLAVTKKPTFATKAVEDILTPQPLPPPLIKLAEWMSEYYATHFATVLQTILPAGLHKQRRNRSEERNYPFRKRTKIVLSPDQRRALMIAHKSSAGTFLLHGATGSGKTQVYIEAAKHEARQGRSSIILVPEIALTPQLVAEFAHHFQNLIVTHSGLTEAERHTLWLKALQSKDEPIVVIGPRSALFMPLSNLGLIVVDECHEPSYKQDQAPRYSALRVASVLAKLHNKVKVILGSATPSVADYYLAKSTKNPILRLAQPVVRTHEVLAEVVDLKQREHFKKHRFLSDTLLKKIEQALANKEQVLLFHNRRGTAPSTMCDHCGWVALCSSCYLPMTLHADKHELRCHLCGQTQNIPPSCPECHEPTITFKGIGTKLIEGEIVKLFPKAHVARFDADTHSSEAVHSRYQELYDGHIDILIGTQMLAKGLDLPHLSTVGVIQADSGLILPDYLAEERVFQLLYQVMGRAGRGLHAGQVVIQTYHPDHAIVQAALARDYQRFYEAELKKRQTQRFPPFRYLLKLTCSYKTEKGAVQASRKLATQLRKGHPHIEVLGPTPAFHERLGGAYRWQLILKSRQRSDLLAIAKDAPQGWQADLDPMSLL
ncbi:MAG: replication restart helicase PriA [Candidatus Saccharimonadales bacterium]